MKNVCLTVAGSDSGGEAGIQADLKTFTELGVFGLSVITAVTAQNPQILTSINPVSPKCMSEQLKAIDYFKPQFVKSGLLCNVEQIMALSNYITPDKALVADPLMVSTSGKKLMDPNVLKSFVTELMPKCSVLTPNFPEIEQLTGIEVNSKKDVQTALKHLFDQCGASVYLKGGHSQNPGTDYLYNGTDILRLSCSEVKITSSHGTGCRLSSALCASLALGENLQNAAISAKKYVLNCLKNCATLKNGLYVMDKAGKVTDNHIEAETL